MRTIFFFLLLLTTLHAQECEEQVVFSFDQREWEEGFQASDPHFSIVEFVLKGETVDNWSELVTVQRLPRIEDPEEYYQLFMEDLNQSIAPQKAESKVLKKTNDTIFFKWWIGGNDAQHEWFKLMITPSSSLVIRFTVRDLDKVSSLSPIWEKLLDAASYSPHCP